MTDEECIAAFFEELDRRIRGTSGHASPERRARLARMRPVLAQRAKDDPEGFARRLRRNLPPVSPLR